MKLLIDADGCPVVGVTLRLGARFRVPCLILCDTAHEFHRPGCETLVFDKGADSVDFALVNRVMPGDIVVTRDYGLASMCLAKNARVLHQDGWAYTEDNIQALLFQRHPVRYRVVVTLLALDATCRLNRTAVKQKLLGQGRFTRVRMRDDRKGPALSDFFL